MAHNIRSGVWIIIINGSDYLFGRVNEPVQGQGAKILQDDLESALTEHGVVCARLFPVYQLDCSFFPAQSGNRVGVKPVQSFLRIEYRMGFLNDAPPLTVAAKDLWFVSDFPEETIAHFGKLVEMADDMLRAARTGLSLT